MGGKLVNTAALKAHVDAVVAATATSENVKAWYGRLTDFLEDVQAGIPSKLDDPFFLKVLWDENPVAATGMGSVKTAPALEDAAFRAWFAAQVTKPLPSGPVDIEAQLISLYDGLREKLKVLCGRTPLLKMNRVLCTLYPEHFTTIADRGKLFDLHIEMGGSRTDHPVRAHKAIRERVDALLPPAPSGDKLELVRRVCLPWLLYDRIADDSSVGSKSDPAPQDAPLKPLPATLRRKGLTSLKGGFPALLGFLPELGDGISKDEFAELIKQSNPGLAANSVQTCINVVAREFDLCRRDGDTYRLSARGINLLENQDPDEFADHLLTKVLGVDHVLKALEAAPHTRTALCFVLRNANPGWTADFAPNSLINWLISLDTIKFGANKELSLTDRGKRWAQFVTWEPQALPKPAETVEEVKAAIATITTIPAFTDLWARLSALTAGKLVVDQALVAQLHAGLWFHPARHFAVLTGISGSGKTQLAHKYALALCNQTDADHDRVLIVPVQPAWYDPAPLLGYVNPLQDAAYRSAPFLELMLRAAEDPEHPYVAILDEMNLSHPEQYLAPVLSAMETREALSLHQFSEGATDTPGRVPYPTNLAIIGTLNMDETTHGLSDKVLDRAYTLEFWSIQVSRFPGWELSTLPEELKQKTQVVLTQLVEALEPVRLHFGWRTIDDVLNYLTFHATLSPPTETALDNVIYAKVLPKLRGEHSNKFELALAKAHSVFTEHGMVRCGDKVKALQDDLTATGSARFWR